LVLFLHLVLEWAVEVVVVIDGVAVALGLDVLLAAWGVGEAGDLRWGVGRGRLVGDLEDLFADVVVIRRGLVIVAAGGRFAVLVVGEGRGVLDGVALENWILVVDQNGSSFPRSW
jgi:hypothetical protein